MIKTIRKPIAILMSVFFMISLIPSAAFADGEVLAQSFGEGGAVSIRPAYTHVSYAQESDAPIGGRSDKSSVFTIGEVPSGVNVTHTSGYKWAPDSSKNYTFEMSVYFSGNAYPAVNAMWDDDLGPSLLMKVDSDGYVNYNNNGATTKSEVKLDSEKWHKIAVEYQASRGRFAIYVNNTMLTDFTYNFGAANADELWIGVAKHSYSGYVAYDDFESYYGAYVPEPADLIVTTDTEYLKFDTTKETITYNPEVYSSPESLAEAIKNATNSTYVKIYEDSTLSQEVTTLSDGNVAEFTSPGGTVTANWQIKALSTDANLISGDYGYDKDGNEIGVYKDYRNSNITWSETTGGLGGKSQDDKSFVFTATDIPEGAAKKSVGVKYAGLDYNKDYVFEMNILVDGADATVNYMYEDNGYELIKYLSDGTFMYRENDTYVDAGKYETGKWHRLVIWYDGTDGTSQRRRHSIYLDGERLTENGKYMTNTAAVIMPGIDAYTSSEGTVAFDDFKAYYVGGDYSPNPADKIAFENSDNLNFNEDTKTLVYNPYVYTDVTSVIQAVETAAQSKYTVLFSDSSLSSKAEELTDECVLVFTSPNGKSYGYYSLNAMTEEEAMMKSLGLSSNSNLVQILDSSIGVISHSYDSDYFTDSDEVIAALSSSAGYTLSYVDADKNELGFKEEIQDEETVEVPVIDVTVTDGFIKAEKGDNVFYIPVEKRGKVNTDISTSVTGAAAVLDNDRTGYVTVSTTATSAIGGKTVEDIDYVITASNVPESAKACTVGLKYMSLPLVPATFEMNVYMDGDAEFAVNYGYEEDAFRLFAIQKDGTIIYNYSSSGNYLTSPFKAESGKWHKVAVTYDAQRTRCHFYVDGNLITDMSQPLTIKNIMIGAGSATTNGTVAIADFESYYGYYNYIDVVRVENGKITAKANDDIINGACVFALAEYAGGKMVAINPVWVTKDSNESASLEFNPDSTYKAFLWNGENAAPVVKAVYYR
ncbi:MAG: LamG domain-containing protein [Ruminococcaceae bacterium]|nr:LamG domain-containing protein [Oscillospiraceae bacterium]